MSGLIALPPNVQDFGVNNFFAVENDTDGKNFFRVQWPAVHQFVTAAAQVFDPNPQLQQSVVQKLHAIFHRTYSWNASQNQSGVKINNKDQGLTNLALAVMDRVDPDTAEGYFSMQTEEGQGKFNAMKTTYDTLCRLQVIDRNARVVEDRNHSGPVIRWDPNETLIVGIGYNARREFIEVGKPQQGRGVPFIPSRASSSSFLGRIGSCIARAFWNIMSLITAPFRYLSACWVQRRANQGSV